jgi:hypothetical protein
MRAPKYIVVLALLLISISSVGQDAHPQKPSATGIAIPKTWDDKAMATLEVPLANPVGSPKHASADYYYRIPVRPIYKSYPVYAPGHEPPGYWDWLKQQEPVIMWDDSGHKPPLQTEADWIKAGEIVFDAPILLKGQGDVDAMEVRQPAWYEKTGVSVTKDGVMPFLRYSVRKKGQVELGALSCATCHTRVMPDGTTLEGAQGSFPIDRSVAYGYRTSVATAKDPAQALNDVRANERSLYAMPWLRPDPLALSLRQPPTRSRYSLRLLRLTNTTILKSAGSKE